MQNIPIILLAAGNSNRMRGADKLMMDVNGQPLVRHLAEIARAVTNAPVIVTLPPRPHLRYRALDGCELRLVPVTNAEEGMNASIRAGFAALPDDASAAMLLLSDLPELTRSDLSCVMQAHATKPDNLVWRGATKDLKPGHPVIFAASLFDDVKRLEGDGGARDAVALAGDRVVLVPLPGQHARRDLDTPEDWAVWRAGRSKER
jgi:molybdenum cofactor cytidylyltransferase